MRTFRLWMLLSLSLFLVSAADNCDDLVAAFDNEAAVDCYRGSLFMDPYNFDLQCKFARALIDAGEDAGGDAAEDWFSRAVKLAEGMAARYPESAEGHYYLAVAKGRLAQFLGGKEKVAMAREIRESVDRALAIDPDHAEALLTRGIYFYELATLNRALRFFAKVLYGGLPEGDLDMAEADFVASLRLDPGNTNTLHHLALIRYRQGNYEACAKLCQEAIAQPVTDHLDPRNQKLAEELEAKASRKLGKADARR